MHLKQKVLRVRARANMPLGDGRVRNSTIASFTNYGKDLIAKKILGQDAKFFEVVNSVNVVGGTAEYDIPVKYQKITLVQRLDAAGEVIQTPVPYRAFQFKDQDRNPASGWSFRGFQYYLRGHKIGLDPVPSESITAGLRIYQLQHPHDELWGVVDAVSLTTTQFLIPETAEIDGGLLKAGYCHTEDDYYVNAKGRIITGAARGLEFTITAFDPATLLATITPAWTVADVTGQEFCILSGIPPEYHNAEVGYAIREIAGAKDQALYAYGDRLWQEGMDMIETDASPRHIDEPTCMGLPDADQEA